MPDSRNSQRTDDIPGVIAPPPLLFGGALAIGLAADFLLMRVPTGLPDPARYSVGAFLIVAALGLVTAALLRFRRSGTPESRGNRQPRSSRTASMPTHAIRCTWQ